MQGHVAYPHRATNPIPPLARVIAALDAVHLDDGTDAFPPSNLEFTAISTRRPTRATSSPARRRRSSTSASTICSAARTWCGWSRRSRSARRPGATVRARISGEAFLTPPGKLFDVVVEAIEEETGAKARAVDQRRHLGRPFPDRSSARWSISACPTRPCTRSAKARRSRTSTRCRGSMSGLSGRCSARVHFEWKADIDALNRMTAESHGNRSGEAVSMPEFLIERVQCRDVCSVKHAQRP